MLKIIARIVDGTKVYGYRVDDSQTQQQVNLDKLSVWKFAKDKQVYNVKASGTEQDMILSGTDGFELKKLPDIKYVTDKKYTSQDILAAEIRGIINNKILVNMEQAEKTLRAKELLKDEHDTLTNDLSGSIVLLNTLADKNGALGIVVADKLGRLKATSTIIGYKLQYNSNEPLLISRIDKSGSKSEIQIQPNSIICLNRAETALLASNININCRFANAKLYRGSKQYTRDILVYLSNTQLVFTDANNNKHAISAHDDAIKQTVQDNVSKEEAEKYFELSDLKKKTQKKKVTSKINSASSLTNAFNAFKK